MKTFKILFCALALVAALAGSKAMGHDLTLSISGTVKLQALYGNTKGTVTTQSFSEKGVYQLITNAVIYAGSATSGAIAPTNFPANGYIAFNPYGTNYTTNGTVYGTFYITNKSGFYYPLSGTDTNGNYYSFMELDTAIYYDASTNGPDTTQFNLGFDYFDNGLFFGVATYNISKSNSGSNTSTSKALLYVHDDPYDFGDPNGNDGDYTGSYGQDFYPFDDNNRNAFEIGGVLTTQLEIKNGGIDSLSFSLTGSGNFVLSDYEFSGVLTSGSAKFQ